MNAPSQKTLIIDDDALLRSLISGILRGAGMQIVGEVSTGEAGLKLCQETLPELVLLDINLPGIDGISLLDQLKALNPAPKVIMISGDATIDRVKESLTKGANGFVVKPFNAAKLLAAVEAALKRG